jgi:hypothetical protein
MSRKKELIAQYNAMRAEDYPSQECMSCGQVMSRTMMDRHHPAGRFGTNILKYIYLCRECHSEAHDDPMFATERGLMWPGRNTREITDQQWIELLEKMRCNQRPL